jgi:predicted RND superfamily exporter protein
MMFQQIDRWSRWTMVLMLFLLPWLVYGVIHLPIGSASVHQWLPDGRPEKERYERFQRNFGNDQFLIVSWEGCTIDDLRFEDFRSKLVALQTSDPRLVDSVRNTNDVIRQLMSPPLNLTLTQASSRLEGVLIGREGIAATVVQFTDYGIEHQNESIAQVYQVADAVPGLGRDSIRMAGTVYEAYAVDYAAEASLKTLVIPSSLIGMLLAWVCLRSIRAALAVLIIAGLGQLLAISTVFYTGGKFSAVLIVLPTLVFMLTLSGAVHLMNYYRDVSVLHRDHRGSRAMALGFKPSLLSSITTSLGMASLAISQLAPVREFGLYSAVSLSVATIFLLLGFPYMSDFFCGRLFAPVLGNHGDEPVPDIDAEMDRGGVSDESQVHQSSPWVKRYVRWIENHSHAVSIAGFGILGFSFFGLLFLKSSTKFDDLFPASSPTVRDLSFIEKHLGAIASVEVLLRFPAEHDTDVLTQAMWVEKISDEIRTGESVGAVISSTSFMPVLPKSSAIRDVVKRSIMRSQLTQELPKMVEQRWVAETEAGRVWRVTAKVSALTNDDYGILTQGIRASVSKALRDSAPIGVVDAEFTGLSPVMHETQRMLLKDLGASFTTAFLLITPVMMLIARGWWAGLLIMIPNVLPETLVFGMMAWLDFRLDIAGLLTASVAMGIAVNDTLHFVNWYANRLSAGDSRIEAISDTMSNCALAMIHTMLISCCSMLPFMFAEFIPTRQFACLMIAMIGSSIVGDLVLLPALLLGPLGLCFLSKTKGPCPQS